MLRRSYVIVVMLVAFGTTARTQTSLDITRELRSENWNDRTKAYRALNAQRLTPEIESAFIALLDKEDSPGSRPVADPKIENAAGYEGPLDYFDYVASLQETIMQILERDPERNDGWLALFRSAYGAPSDLTAWFAKHADRTMNYFLSTAQGKTTDTSIPQRARAVRVLGQIARYENDPATNHHLQQNARRSVDSVIRFLLADPNETIRGTAVLTLSEIGGEEDLAILDRVAATDSYFDPDRGYEIRMDARLATEIIRKRLATQPK